MTFLPIVGRELREAARRRSTYWIRLAAAVVALLTGALFFLATTRHSSKDLGIVLFVALAVVTYAYCLLAMGLIDVVIESGLHAWDIQALIPIIEGAGGVVTSWDGGSCEEGGEVVACGDPALAPEVRALLQGSGWQPRS